MSIPPHTFTQVQNVNTSATSGNMNYRLRSHWDRLITDRMKSSASVWSAHCSDEAAILYLCWRWRHIAFICCLDWDPAQYSRMVQSQGAFFIFTTPQTHTHTHHSRKWFIWCMTTSVLVCWQVESTFILKRQTFDWFVRELLCRGSHVRHFRPVHIFRLCSNFIFIFKN